jgi:ribonuclease HI
VIRIWTDGSCPLNPGPGGWAVVVVEDGEIVAKLNGGESEATNNTMEMTAVLEAMRFARNNYPGQQVEIICDSEYVVKGCVEWMARWKARGWKKKSGAIKNLALWKYLDHSYNPATMTLTWVRGHDGDEMNELADYLAGLGSAEAAGRVIEDPEEAFPL